MIIHGIGNCFIKQAPHPAHRTQYRIYRQAVGRGTRTVAHFNGSRVASINSPEVGATMYIQGNNFRADTKLISVDDYRCQRFFHTLIFGMFREDETSIKMIIL